MSNNTELNLSTNPVSAASAASEVVFVDSRVLDSAELLAGVSPDAQVVYLDAASDGLAQMADYLEAHPGVSAVHVLAHGSPGNLWLGSSFLDSTSLAEQSADLARIGQSLTADGDILVYSCDLAAGEVGAAFVETLAALTGADVAASTNHTGAGGDWQLEITTGSVEADLPLAQQAADAYDLSLATLTVTTNTDQTVGASLAADISDDGGLSIREAIAWAAASGDTITFQSGVTNSVLSLGALTIAKSVTIDGDLDNNGSADVTIDANNTSRVLNITSGTVALDGLVIKNGFLTGAGGNRTAGAGGAGGDALGAGINNAGTLTITNSSITANKAAGGGGAGGNLYNGSAAGAGGGGGGFGSTFGGAGGTNFGAGLQAGPAAGVGGRGAGYSNGTNFLGGAGGSTTGGAGSNYGGYPAGGAGATANNGTISIGGGGGGAGYDAPGGAGGNTAAGIYNTGTLTITGSTITNNIAAGGGGGGGGSSAAGAAAGNGGAGGAGVGGIWNAGGTVQIDASTNTSLSTANAGGGGTGGTATRSGSNNGAAGAAISTISTTGGGTTNTNYIPPDTTPPAFSSATVNGNQLVLTYTDANNLDATNKAGTGAFAVVVAGSANAVTAVTVNAAAKTVTLTLTTAATTGQTVTVAYTDPTAGNDTNATQDVAGNDVASFGATSVTNNTPNPTITGASYDASTGLLSVTGTNLASGGAVDLSKLSLIGQGGAYTLTGTTVNASSSTAFSVTLSGTDKLFVNGLLNNTGNNAVDSTAFNLAAAANWQGTATADLTGNAVTVSNVTSPSVTSATYDASTHVLTVSGFSMVKALGATNDITASKLTLSGEGISYTLSSSSDVEITSANSFSITLTGADIAGVSTFLNKSGTTSTSGSTYNLSLADDWNTVINNTDISDTTNAITVSSVPVPALTFSGTTYDAGTGVLVVSGTNFLSLAGGANDIDVSKLSLTGDGGTAVALSSSSSVDITSATSFTVTLSAADRAAVNLWINKNGGTSTDISTYTLKAAENWAAGAASGVTDADLNGNTVQVSGVVAPTITSATYDASTGTLVVTGANFVHRTGANNDIVVSKLSITGDSSAYTLTSSNVEVTSGTSFTVTLNSADIAALTERLNKVGTSSDGAVTYNLAAAEDWAAGAAAAVTIEDLTGNGITVSNVLPTISNASYDASTGILSVTGANMTTGDTIAVSKLTLRGEDGQTYTLTSGDVTADSATAFSVTLNSADQAAVNVFLNKAGTSSTGGTTFNLSATDDWDSNVSSGNTADATNAVTVTNVPAPTITSATYDAASGTLVVTGTGFLQLAGAGNDIDASKLRIVGEGSATYTLTDTSDVDISSGTSFTLTLSAADKAALNQLTNKDGLNSTSGTTYNLVAQEDWAAGADAAVAVADLTGNGVNVSGVPIPTITSATYDAATGILAVTGTGFLSKAGISKDIVANKFTITGQDGTSYTLTDTPNVYSDSGTFFSLTLSATDKAAVAFLLNQNGSTAVGGTAFNLSAADNWAAGADPALNVEDLSNGITVSGVVADVIAPTVLSITSSTADGTYKVGAVISIQVNFSEKVQVSGIPQLTLETGSTDRVINYAGGTGTNTLTFNYTVQAGDTSADLDFTSTSALSLNGGSISDAATNSAELALASPGAAGSLAANAALVIDTTAPTLVITSSASTLGVGDTALITFTFTEDPGASFAWDGSTGDVVVTGGTLSAISGSGLTRTATFTPTAGIAAGTASITVASAAYTDAAGNDGGAGTSPSISYDTFNAVVTGNASADVIRGGLGADSLDGAGGSDRLAGREGNDLLDGGEGDDKLFGEEGDDDLLGGNGRDALNGGEGADTMAGGDGNDFYYVDDADDVVLETNTSTSAGEVDTVYSYLSDYTLTSNIEQGVINISGAASLNGNTLNNVLTGGAGDNTLDGQGGNDRLDGENGNDSLIGGTGHDTLDGGTGADTMEGGDGNDIYYVDNAGDIVTETNTNLATGGTDAVYSYLASYTLTDNIERGLIKTSAAASLTGNELANTLYGGDGNDSLFGVLGNDTLSGGAGADQLTGGEGRDLLIGGLGADTFVFHGGSGRDAIQDFNRTEGDKISLQSNLNGSGITDAASALAHVSDMWGSAVLDLGGGNVIKLTGLMTADLTVADFMVF